MNSLWTTFWPFGHLAFWWFILLWRITCFRSLLDQSWTLTVFRFFSFFNSKSRNNYYLWRKIYIFLFKLIELKLDKNWNESRNIVWNCQKLKNIAKLQFNFFFSTFLHFQYLFEIYMDYNKFEQKQLFWPHLNSFWTKMKNFTPERAFEPNSHWTVVEHKQPFTNLGQVQTTFWPLGHFVIQYHISFGSDLDFDCFSELIWTAFDQFLTIICFLKLPKII